MIEILSFSEENLAKALSNDYTPVEVIMEKNHFDYFLRYLGEGGLHACSIVIEEEYISKDYLDDYAEYYAVCFQKYPKFCKRIHFFKTTITEGLLNKVILGDKELPEKFWDDYLGFVVVKPIPETVIGFTLLHDYNTSISIPERQYWGLREYKVHFFGHETSLSSLAFQEQDSVLAACATTAIWSMLNKASCDYHTVLKSPNEITRDAGNLMPDGNRIFPNRGLDVQQICRAIFISGLVSEVKQGKTFGKREDGGSGCYITNSFLKKYLNAHSTLGIPVILVIEVPYGMNFGLHAITVTGFKAAPLEPIQPAIGTTWFADNIDKIYAHDDQFGPFVRIELFGDMELDSPWTDKHDKRWATRVTDIIIPVFPKVRISYEDVESIVSGLDAILSIFFDRKIKFELVWDIKIKFSEKFKSEIRERNNLDNEKKLNLLVSSLPKYIWVATCFIGDHQVLEFIFDATDVSNGMIGKRVISYLPPNDTAILHEFLDKNSGILKSVFRKSAKLHYFDFLMEQLK